MKYFLGTAGFMIGSKKWLGLQSLNCIEINSTFYRLPTDSTVKNWNNYPDNIKLTIKASKYITHIKRLKDVEESCNLLWEKIMPCREKIIAILFQLPPYLINNKINLERIKQLKKYFPDDINIVIEFRNDSWLTDEIYNEMEKIGVIICGTYINKKNNSKWIGSMPSGLNFGNPNSNISYMRIHGMQGYKGELSEDILREIHNKMLIGNKKIYIIIFNNTFFKNRKHYEIVNNIKINYAAVYNAIEMYKLLI